MIYTSTSKTIINQYQNEFANSMNTIYFINSQICYRKSGYFFVGSQMP